MATESTHIHPDWRFVTTEVLPASEIVLTWDGNALCALVGPDLVEGVPGSETLSTMRCATWCSPS